MTEPLNSNTIKQGDSYTFNVTLSEGTIPTGATVRFCVKKQITDPDSAAIIMKSSQSGGGITVLTTTTAQIEILPADTRNLAFPGNCLPVYFDLQITTSAGRVDAVKLENNKTIGKFTIEKDICQQV